jgi:hypothetical protein
MSGDEPKHKYVDGELVELTQAEIDAIMAERGALEPDSKPAAKEQPKDHAKEQPHGRRRT